MVVACEAQYPQNLTFQWPKLLWNGLRHT